MDISTYGFAAENVVELLAKNETARSQLRSVVDSYSEAVVALQNSEVKACVAEQQYRGEPFVGKLVKRLAIVHSSDKSIHEFNDARHQIGIGTEAQAAKTRIAPLVRAASAAVAKLQQNSDEPLRTYSK